MRTLEDKYMARTRQFRYRGYTIVATCTRDQYYDNELFFPVVEIYQGKKYLKSKVLGCPLTSPTQNFKLEEREGKLLVDQLK